MDENYRKSLEAMLLHVERINAAASQFSNLSQQMDFARRVADTTKNLKVLKVPQREWMSMLQAAEQMKPFLASQHATLLTQMPLATSPAIRQIQEFASRFQLNQATETRKLLEVLTRIPALTQLYSNMQTPDNLLQDSCSVLDNLIFSDVLMDKFEKYEVEDVSVEIDEGFSSAIFETLKSCFPSLEIPINLPVLTLSHALTIIAIVISVYGAYFSYQSSQETKLYREKVIELLEKQASIQEYSTSHPASQPNTVNNEPVKKLTDPISD
ncbi:hypothetical protein [uncultured Anaeromusa sp.]|uniref:hypothetical protein n=1 Tax=uncultured Anaeromusa sp. TaxID=673273 RepID=UPI0029C79996|nr:hypothetical protein [uncultured Anaeromusa sp.]